jgi:hypothetical protein
MDTQESKASYSLNAAHPETHDVISETHATIKAVVNRSVELIRAGYAVVIDSTTDQDGRSKGS